MKIILGSKSQGRKIILTQMGYKFSVMDPNIDEKAIRHKDPKMLVLKLARAKAAILLPKIKKPSILITADQVVLCNQTILEKPKNRIEAKKFLKMHGKYPTKTITAIIVTNTANRKQKSGVNVATIWFRPIPEAVIKNIIKQKYVLNCAGGISIEDPKLKKYILKIKGAKDSIIGLPIKLTKKLIADLV